MNSLKSHSQIDRAKMKSFCFTVKYLSIVDWWHLLYDRIWHTTIWIKKNVNTIPWILNIRSHTSEKNPSNTLSFTNLKCEWVSDYCLTPNEQCISYIMARTRYFQWNDDDFLCVLDQHGELDFYSASSLKQQSSGRHVAPLGNIILIPSQPFFALTP